MINVGEFKSNQLNTSINPIPTRVKVSWENSEGESRSELVDLDFLPGSVRDGAIILDIDEHEISAIYLDEEEFAAEWKERLIRKGYL